jgi:hypothetical protein
VNIDNLTVPIIVVAENSIACRIFGPHVAYLNEDVRVQVVLSISAGKIRTPERERDAQTVLATPSDLRIYQDVVRLNSLAFVAFAFPCRTRGASLLIEVKDWDTRHLTRRGT